MRRGFFLIMKFKIEQGESFVDGSIEDHLIGITKPSIDRMLRMDNPGDAIALYEGLQADGFIKPGIEIDPNAVLDFLLPLVEPIRVDHFHYTREWLRIQSVRVGDPRNPTAKIGLALNLPPEYLLIHRVTLGTTGILCQLSAAGAFRAEAAPFLPVGSVRIA